MRYDKPTHNSQPAYRDQYYQNRNTKAYDRYKIPQGDNIIMRRVVYCDFVAVIYSQL